MAESDYNAMYNPSDNHKGLPQNGRTVEQLRRFRPVRKMPYLLEKAGNGLVFPLGTRTPNIILRLFPDPDLRDPSRLAKRPTNFGPFSLN